MPLNLNQARVIDPILTTVIQGYQNTELVGEIICPRVEVDASGGQILQFGKEAFVLYDTQRAPGGATPRMNLGYYGKPFALEIHGLEALAPDQITRDARAVPGIDLARTFITAVQDANLLKLEYQISSLLRNAANYSAGNKIALTAGSQFSDPGLDVKALFQAGRAAIRAKTGKYPNTLILGPNQKYALSRNTAIRDQFKYSSPDSLTLAMLAQYLEIERVIEGNGVYAAHENADFSDVWGKDCVLAYVPPGGRSYYTPGFAYTYTLRGHPLVRNPYRDENRESWAYPTSFERAPVITGQDAGYLMQNVLP